jgi:hypothetical protein
MIISVVTEKDFSNSLLAIKNLPKQRFENETSTKTMPHSENADDESLLWPTGSKPGSSQLEAEPTTPFADLKSTSFTSRLEPACQKLGTHWIREA